VVKMNKLVFVSGIVFSSLVLFGCTGTYESGIMDTDDYAGQGIIFSFDKNNSSAYSAVHYDAVCNEAGGTYYVFSRDINGKQDSLYIDPILIDYNQNAESYLGKKVNIVGKEIKKWATLCDPFGNCTAPACRLLVIENVNLIE